MGESKLFKNSKETDKYISSVKHLGIIYSVKCNKMKKKIVALYFHKTELR